MNENDESIGPQASRRRGAKLLAAALVLVVAVGGFAIWFLYIGDRGQCSSWGCDTHNEVGAVKRIDPALVKYAEVGRVPTGLEKPRGIALGPDGTLYMAGDHEVRVFAKDGTSKTAVRLDDEPFCLAVAGDGTVYIGTMNHIEVYGPDGALRASWSPLGNKAHITSISAAGGDVWVADAGQRQVVHYNTSGQLLGVFGKKDEKKSVPGLVIPSPHMDVAAVPGGSVWVANTGRYRLELYGPDGSIKRSWGKASFDVAGFCGCCNPTDFAMFPDGRFVTSEKGLPRVKIYSPDGRLECVVAPPELFTNDERGVDLAVGRKGTVYALDKTAGVVRIFARKAEAK